MKNLVTLKRVKLTLISSMLTCTLPAVATISPGGMAGWNWSVSSQAPLTSITFPFVVNTSPLSGYFYAQQFGFTGADWRHSGYIGIQPRSSDKFLAVFSSFFAGTEVVDGQRCRSGADGGPGVSCSAWHHYEPGKKYLFEVRQDNVDKRVWHGLVKEEGSNEATPIGSWRLPAGMATLRTSQAGWIEFPGQVAGCYVTPLTQITVSPPYVTSTGTQGTLSNPHQYGRCKGKINYDYQFKGKDLKNTVGQPMVATDPFGTTLVDADLESDSLVTIVVTKDGKELEKHTVSIPEEYRGKYQWPAYAAKEFNNNLKRVILGELNKDTGEINIVAGSSYRNLIWKNKLDNIKVIPSVMGLWTNETPYGDSLYSGDLEPGSSVMISVKNQQNKILEEYTVIVPDEWTGKYSWPGYTGTEFNKKLAKVKIGEKSRDNDIKIIAGSSYRNKIWQKSPENLIVTAEVFTAARNPWINEDLFGNRLATDLEPGSDVTIKIKNSQENLLEEHTVEIPDDHLSVFKWPGFAANEFNKMLKSIIIGEKGQDGKISVINNSQYGNLIWKKERANLTVEVSINPAN